MEILDSFQFVLRKVLQVVFWVSILDTALCCLENRIHILPSHSTLHTQLLYLKLQKNFFEIQYEFMIRYHCNNDI